MPHLRKAAVAGIIFFAVLIGYFAATRTNVYEALSYLNPTTKDQSALTETRESSLVPVGILGQTLYIPEGFGIRVFAEGLGKVRLLENGGNGEIYASLYDQGKVAAFIDEDNDGVSDRMYIYSDGLNKPHGLAYYDGSLFIAEEDKVSKIFDYNRDLKVDLAQKLISLPSGGNHGTRTIAIGNGKVYISVGSSCNACADGKFRAEVLVYDLGTQELKTFAAGLRNSVGIVLEDGKLYCTDNGMDLLGENLPAEEVNLIEEGKHYGWPYCYDDNLPDPGHGSEEICVGKAAPLIKMQAHSAPLGLRFIKNIPEYKGSIFIAFHGSWNRKVPTGYKIVRAYQENGEYVIEDLVTGFLVGTKAWGRPVDIIEYKNGILFTDDFSGRIFYLYKP